MTANGWFLLFWPQASQIWPLPNAPRSETVLIRFVSQNKFLIAEADAVLQGAGRERGNSTIPVPARSPPHRQPVARADLDGVCAQRHPSIQRCGRAIARGNSRKASPSRRPWPCTTAKTRSAEAFTSSSRLYTSVCRSCARRSFVMGDITVASLPHVRATPSAQWAARHTRFQSQVRTYFVVAP